MTLSNPNNKNKTISRISAALLAVFFSGVSAQVMAAGFSFASQPSDKTVKVGQSVNATVKLNLKGSASKLRTQWYKNGAKVGGVRSGLSGLTISTGYAKKSYSGYYSCVIQHEDIVQRCRGFRLTVGSGAVQTTKSTTTTTTSSKTAVSISRQPSSVVVNEGSRLSLSASVTGSTPIYYQWYRNGNKISGATNPTISVSSAQTANSGNYYVIAKNSVSSTKSSTATVKVTTSASGEATISWTRPSRRTDGSYLGSAEIKRYDLYRVDSNGNAKYVQDSVSASKTQIVVDSLSQGTHRFALATVDVNGVSSKLSSVINVKID